MHDKRMNSLPVLISYPRSGSNWLNAVMELYFDRPRLRKGPSSFLKDYDKRNDFMWFHDHDIHSKINLPHKNIAYLYRDPADVIYSLLKAEKKPLNEDFVNKQIALLAKHYKKYLLSGLSKTIIRYEMLKGPEWVDEFTKFIRFFGFQEVKPKIRNKLKKYIQIVQKDKLIANNKNNVYFTKKLVSKEYANNRIAFKKKFESYINEKLITKDLKQFFK